MRTETADLKGDAEIERWRRERLAHSGFSRELAACVAADARYDLHALIGLVERGCAPELAVQILAPTEEAELDCAAAPPPCDDEACHSALVRRR